MFEASWVVSKMYLKPRPKIASAAAEESTIGYLFFSVSAVTAKLMPLLQGLNSRSTWSLLISRS